MSSVTEEKERVGYIELVIAMCLSGMIGMFVTFSKQPILNVVFFRCLIGGASLFIYLLAKKMLTLQSIKTKKNAVLIFIVSIAVVLNWVALFSSYSYTSIGIATTIYHVQPLIVFFVGALLFKEKITSDRLIWLALAFVGVILMINPFNSLTLTPGYLKGCGLALIAACLYAIATLCTKKINEVSPYIITLFQLLIGTILLSPLVNLTILPQTPIEWGSILVLGVIHSAFMYILLYSSFQKLSTSSIAILSYLYPSVAVAIDYIVFHKSLSTLQIIGGIMICIAGMCNKLGINPIVLIRQRLRMI